MQGAPRCVVTPLAGDPLPFLYEPLSHLRLRWAPYVLSLQGPVGGGPVSPGAQAPVTGSRAQQQQQQQQQQQDNSQPPRGVLRAPASVGGEWESSFRAEVSLTSPPPLAFSMSFRGFLICSACRRSSSLSFCRKLECGVGPLLASLLLSSRCFPFPSPLSLLFCGVRWRFVVSVMGQSVDSRIYLVFVVFEGGISSPTRGRFDAVFVVRLVLGEARSVENTAV